MNTLYYLAYGSNLHPVRLIQRVPSATLIGTVKLSNSRIVFHKRSVDSSGKCMILNGEIENSFVYGALYSIETKQLELLDKAEGDGYQKQFVKCAVGETEYSAFTYVAKSQSIDNTLKPYYWYKQLVLAGARYHQFPASYLANIEDVESIPDLDSGRRLFNEKILADLT